MITTHEELIKLHGKSVTCEIEGEYIDDAKISVQENGRVYICQNEKKGENTDDKLGHEYSWGISYKGVGYEENNRYCTKITLVTKEKEKPTKPIMEIHQEEQVKWSDDNTLYSKKEISFNSKKYSHEEWNEFVALVKKVDKRYKDYLK
jgi:hypothetical protein